ncbi:inositol-tetrakisphosphate 1-kinase isoform X3 [Vulpes vulpes]|uniref:Inositol-tetrakisphosphate 1-kinase isoform X3 n=1 Tax=Vulpes vulpes TaxID=9627 RepID=A0ABM5AR65_VULVU
MLLGPPRPHSLEGDPEREPAQPQSEQALGVQAGPGRPPPGKGDDLTQRPPPPPAAAPGEPPGGGALNTAGGTEMLWIEDPPKGLRAPSPDPRPRRRRRCPHARGARRGRPARPVGDFLRTRAPRPRKKMQTFLKGKRVGYWLSEKKIKKLNFQAFAELCRKRGIEVVQEYIDAHPETIVLDPLPAIRTLLDRSKSYELIRKIEAYMKDDRICSPPFMELTSLSGDDTMRLLEQNGLAFPFICKTRVAHGTNSHEMAIVFNQEGLSAIQPPCVVQNFINHNAVLYKVFVVGESYTVVQRPSLKNFSAGTSGSSPGPSLVPPVWTGSGRSGGRTVGYSGAARGLCAPLAGRMPDRESIFFNSHNVSKPESSSVLTALDKIEGVFERPSDEVIRELSRALRQALGVSLFGIDIIINNQTGQHAVIDINAFPGYEGVSEFFTDLLNHVATVLQGQSTATAAAGDVAPLRHSRLLAEQAGSLAGERTCSAGPGCCGSMMGPDPPWTSEADAGGMGAGGTAKLPHQRLGCTAAVSPSFQQHCVASLATKASSQ